MRDRVESWLREKRESRFVSIEGEIQASDRDKPLGQVIDEMAKRAHFHGLIIGWGVGVVMGLAVSILVTS